MASARLASTKSRWELGATVSGAAPLLSTSPRAAADSSMLDRARAVLQRHQCVQQQEAVSVCMKANNKAKPSAVPCECSGYINALRYCELATTQHNYPVNTAFLF